MIRIFEFDALKPEEILNRDIRAEASVEATVDAIIADVRARGDAALKDYALKFDHAQLDELRVSQAEIDEAFEAAGEDFVTTLKMAAANIRAFHEHQVHKNFVMNDTPGIVLGQKYTPIEKAGRYRRLPQHRTDGCDPRQGGRCEGDRDDHPRRAGWQGESLHPGCCGDCRY